jgi:hypothetical protein
MRLTDVDWEESFPGDDTKRLIVEPSRLIVEAKHPKVGAPSLVDEAKHPKVEALNLIAEPNRPQACNPFLTALP